MSRRAQSMPPVAVEKTPCSRCTTAICLSWKFLTCILSHLTLVGLVVVYCIIGAKIFEELESDNEKQVKKNIRGLRTSATNKIWNMTNSQNYLFERNWTKSVTEILTEFEMNIMRAIKNDGWDGQETEEQTQWTFIGSLFYSIIVITTIGYGHIAPKTDWGKVTTIFYAILGIPLMLLCLSNIGDVMAGSFRFLYWRVCCFVCTREPKRGHSKRLRGTRASVRQVNRLSSRSQPTPTIRRSIRTSQKSADSGFVTSYDAGLFHAYSDPELRRSSLHSDLWYQDERNRRFYDKERERDRNRRAHPREWDHNPDRNRNCDRDRAQDRDRDRDRDRNRDRDTDRDWDRIRDRDRDREREHGRDRDRNFELDRARYRNSDRVRDRDRAPGRIREHDLERDFVRGEDIELEYDVYNELNRDRSRIFSNSQVGGRSQRLQNPRDRKDRNLTQDRHTVERERNVSRLPRTDLDNELEFTNRRGQSTRGPRAFSAGHEFNRMQPMTPPTSAIRSRSQTRSPNIRAKSVDSRLANQVIRQDDDKAPVFCNRYAIDILERMDSKSKGPLSSRSQSMPRQQQIYGDRLDIPETSSNLPRRQDATEYYDDNFDEDIELEPIPKSRRAMTAQPPVRRALPPSPRIMSPMGFTVRRQQRPSVSDDIFIDDDLDLYGDGPPRSKSVPIWLCVFLVISYIISGAFLFKHWENWNFLDSAYFCFITLTTIGFGDFVPAQRDVEDPEKSIAWCSLYLLFGISLLAMSFNLVQEEVIANVKNVAKRLGILKEEEPEE